MISKENISEIIARYEYRKHPRLNREWQELVLPFEFGLFRKYNFYELKEILEEDNEVYLAHNGEIEIGLSFEEVVSILNIHPDPNSIPWRSEKIGDNIFWRRTFGSNFDRDFNLVSHWRESCNAYVTDEDPQIESNLYNIFLEDLFSLPVNSFRSCIVQAGYGLRLDEENPLRRLLLRTINEKTPVFIHRVEVGLKKDEAYVINGFRV